MGTFFDCRRFPEVMSNAWALTPSTGTLPGPQEPIARLLWLATDAAEEAWVPTPEEQDERWTEFQRAMQASMDARRRAGSRGLVHRIRPDAIEIADRVGGAGGLAEQMAERKG